MSEPSEQAKRIFARLKAERKQDEADTKARRSMLSKIIPSLVTIAGFLARLIRG